MARAARNHGIVTFDEAIADGHTPRTISRRAKNGEWIRVLPRIFILSAHPLTWESRLTAALRWGGPNATVSHSSAAALYGLEGFAPGLVEISKPDGTKGPKAIVCHRLQPDDRIRKRWVKGFPTTWLERTFLDLAAVRPMKQVGRALDDALQRRITTLARLRDELSNRAKKGRRGTKTLRALADSRDGDNEALRSRFELKMLQLLRCVNGAALTVGHPVSDGSENFFLDFAFPERKLAVECHSVKWHLGDNWRRDFRRNSILSLLGWHILYFTWQDVHFAPDEIRSEVGRALHTHRS